MNFCVKNPPLGQAAKRYRQAEKRQWHIANTPFPVIPHTVSNFIDLALKVKANDEDAKIFILARKQTSFNGDDKIAVLFDAPNQQFRESFTTKYFDMTEPGVLIWGHETGIFTLEK